MADAPADSGDAGQVLRLRTRRPGVSLPPGCAQLPSTPGRPNSVLPGEEVCLHLLMVGPPSVSLRTGSL